jgi:O-acetylhomoserine/O-acetylserine sulfhydrylase-like pyridoxal-dependent enzyme
VRQPGFIDNVLLPFQRNTGPNCAPFNAWVVLKGLETLDLRIQRRAAMPRRWPNSWKAACR